MRAGTSTQLLMQGKPFLFRNGELHNSSAAGAAYLRLVRVVVEANIAAYNI